MAEYRISSGSGFTGNAQYYSGSKYEGISLNGISSGSKYHVIMQYRSSVPLSIYSGDYGDYHISTNNIAIPENTGSAKFWSGEFLSIAEENYIGLTNTGWFEVDQVRVKHIPNLVSNGTFNTSTGWSYTGNITYSNNKAIFTGGSTTNLMYGITIPIKRYRLTLQVSNYVSGTLTCMIGNNPYSTFGVISGNGVYSFDLTPSVASIGLILLQGNSTFIGEVDNVHLYEIPEWVSTGNHYCDVTLLDKSSVSQSLMLIATGSGRAPEYTSDFSAGVDGWTNYSGFTLVGNQDAVVDSYGVSFDNCLKLTCNTTGTSLRIQKSLAVNIGNTYYISGWVWVPNSVTSFVLHNGNTNQDLITLYSTSSPPNYTTGRWTQINKVATIVTNMNVGYIQLYFAGIANGEIIYLKDIVVGSYYGQISLPSANLESVVSGKKYTLEGFARLDASSLGYGVTNLVTNGTFDTVTTGWSAVNGATLSIESETLKVLSVNAYGMGTQAITTVANKIYKLTFRQNVESGAAQRICWISSTWQGSNILDDRTTPPIVGWQYYTLYFRATTTTTYVAMGISGTGKSSWIDDVMVVESDAVAPTITSQIGTKSVTSTALSIVPNTFTKFVLNFEATSAEVNQDLKLYLNGSGSVFVDKLSLTQAYDYWVNMNVRDSGITRANIISNSRPYSNYNIVGYELLLISTSLYASITDTNAGATVVASRVLANAIANYSFLINRTDRMYALTNGISGAGPTIVNVGKVTLPQPIAIGARFDSADKWNSLISHAQIIRFDNISQSTFNSSSVGLQFPTGGGTEEVLRLTFQDSSSLSNALKDYSPKNHTLTPYGSIDLTNRVKVSEFRTTDTSASALISRMTTAPSNERKYLIDTTVRNLKSTGVWNKLDCLWMMASHHSQSATLNWIKDAHNLSLVASPTFTVDRGFQGDANTQYINTQFNPYSDGVNHKLNSGSFGIYYRANHSVDTQFDGIISGSDSNTNACMTLSSGYTRMQHTQASNYSPGTSSMGYWIMNRTGSNGFDFWYNSTQTYVNYTSSVVPSGSVYLLGYNDKGSVNLRHNVPEAFAFIGGGLTNTDITNLTSIVENYLRTVGASVT